MGGHLSYILGIDTSCDETSAAILKDDNEICANIISSQIKIHQPFGGVVPELASRSHLQALPLVVDEALKKAGIGLKDLSGIAVTTSPGLIGCLLVGLSYAKALAFSLKIPCTAVHHLKGHLFSGFSETYPFLGLVVSGGHTALYHVKSFDQIACLGQTVDDAAGEAFDKVAKLMGLGYPGGPLIDKLSREGNPTAFQFTRSQVKKGPMNFSFSGLKTAVSRLMPQKPHLADLAASFQKEVVGALIEKTELALDEVEAKLLVVTGGVACNSLLRSEALNLGKERGMEVILPSPLLCTDNGAMIAYVGARQLKQGKTMGADGNALASAPLW